MRLRLRPRWLLVAGVLLTLLSLFSGPSTASAAPACADLRVDSVDVGPEPVIAGTPSTVTIVVTNAGTCTAPGFVTQFRQDENAKTGPNRSVGSLGAGESRTVVITSDFTYQKAGTYLSRVDLDTGRAVPETNEVNNLEIHPVTVVAATRNLTITNFTIAPDPVVQGRPATASVTVKNTGNSPTAAFRVEFKPSATLGAMSQQIDGLAPGEERQVDFDYNYRAAGTVTATATVDSTKRVAETNENDNTAKRTYVVEPPLPDLSIDSATTSPAPAVAGSKTTTTVRVRNEGNNPAGAFVVSFRPAPGAPLLTKQLGGLAVDETTDVTFDYTFPAAGTFAGVATADSTSRVAEVNERNNTRATSTVVQGAGVDLTVSDLRLECDRFDTGGGGDAFHILAEGQCPDGGNVVQGEQVTAVVTVTNTGNAPSGRFVTEWNPDTAGIIPSGPQTVSLETGPLGPGESREVRLEYTYPRAGNFRTLANVDAFNTVKETNEDNNKRILNVVVDKAPIDLVIDDYTLNPADPVRGVPVSATITVRNAGPIATGPFTTQWRPRGGTTPAISAQSQGLQPGETATYTLPYTYALKGSYASTVTVDAFNTVPEPFGEDNNTVTKTVTVAPQQTVVNVAVSNVHVIDDNDGGLKGDGEWDPMFLGVYDPSTHCANDIYGTAFDVPSLACKRFANRDVNDDSDDDDYTPNLTFGPGVADLDVTLQEGAPLLMAFFVSEEDGEEPLLYPDPAGYAYKLLFRSQYRSGGEYTVPGEKCTSNDGHCFDVTFKVTVKSSNVPNNLAVANDAAQQAVAEQTESKFEAVYDDLQTGAQD